MSSLPEVRFEPGTAVICDLHLDLALDDPSPEFERFLESRQGTARLVILGDLFDYWVGPAQLKLAGAPRILEAMKALRASGTQLDVLFGNRDFLLGERFVQRTGAVLRPAGLVGLSPAGERTLLIHGDELCTLDVGYQRLRRVLRSRIVQGVAPRLPLALSERLAKRLRRASTAALQVKPSEEKSMQLSATEQFAGRYEAATVVCGHAHEFRDEEIVNEARWLVLDAFGGKRDCLVAGAEEWEVRCSASGDMIPR